MDIYNFIKSLMTAMIVFGPLAWIYLILYTLNWNQRKNLFSDSWIIFIALVISSFPVYFAFLIADAKFYVFFHSIIPFLFLLLLSIVNTISVAAVLNYRENKKDFSIAVNPDEEINRSFVNENILITSAIVTILTIAMVGSLIMFVSEVSTKMRNQRRSRYSSGYEVYE